MTSVYLVIDVPKPYRPKAEFSLRTILSAFFLSKNIHLMKPGQEPEPGESITLYYGDNPGERKYDVIMHAEPAAFSFYERNARFLPDDVSFIENGERLPLLFGKLKRSDASEGMIYYDLVASAFYFLSDWESYADGWEPDQHGRMPYEGGLQHTLGIADRPLVNEYAELVRDVIQVRKAITLKPKQFGGRDFAVCITHDLDRIQKRYPGTLKRELFDLPFKNPHGQPAAQRWKRVKGTIKDLLKPVDGYERSILGMFEKEKELGIPPTVLFKSILYKHANDAADYLENPFMFVILNKLEALKGECGLHASYEAGYNQNLFRAEKNKLEERLEQPVESHRFHYLRYHPDRLIPLLNAYNIKNDSSIGWAERAGFRSGFTFPYYLFDIARNRTSDILEIPLHMMEMQLLYSMNLNADQAVELAQKQADAVSKHGGVLCWNFHHHALDTVEAEGASVLFERSLSYLHQLKPLFVTMGNVHENL